MVKRRKTFKLRWIKKKQLKRKTLLISLQRRKQQRNKIMIESRLVSEAQEAVIRQQAVIMLSRNYDKPHIMKRVLKRFMKCLKNL